MLGSFRLKESGAVSAAVAAGAASPMSYGDQEQTTRKKKRNRKKPTVSVDRWWLFDTGCPYDLTSYKHPANTNNPVPAETSIMLDTVQGLAVVDQVVEVQMKIGNHQFDMTPYVLRTLPMSGSWKPHHRRRLRILVATVRQGCYFDHARHEVHGALD